MLLNGFYSTPDYRQWQILWIYNGYRLICILIFVVIAVYAKPSLEFSTVAYFILLSCYFLSGLYFFSLVYRQKPSCYTQVLFTGTFDVIVLSVLISPFSAMESGLGVMLNVTVALLSILAPGRLAFFFAAIASCMLLGLDVLQYVYFDNYAVNLVFSGIHGVGLFATALTAWFLAYRVRMSEIFAQNSGHKLKNIQQINEYIVEKIHSGVLFIDENQHIELINSAARNFFNLKKESSFVFLAEISTELSLKYQDFLEKNRLGICSSRINLNEPNVKVNFLAVDRQLEPAVLIFVDDLSLINQQAQQMKLASLGKLSASIAHELRNPLGAISHAVQLMGEATHFDKEDLRLKELIINNCNRMNEVIKNILQLSRGQPSQPQSIQLIPFLEQFRHDFCACNNCTITINELKQHSIFFDKSQLEQILVIICDNAMKHGHNSEGQVHIAVSARGNEKTSELILSDDGNGIGKDLRQDIFDPFFSTTRNGLGMGLFLARDLCEMNNARLLLGAEGRGASFVIKHYKNGEME